MKKLVLLSFLAITGCAGTYTQQTKTQINSMMETEFSAWETVKKLNREQCPVSTDKKPLPSSKAIEKHECWADIVRENVAPVAMASDLLVQHMTNAKQVALDYKKGKLNRDEVNFEHEKLWTVYYTALVARATEAFKHAQQQDQALAQRQGQALQSLSQAVQQQEATQASSQKNTSCHVTAGKYLNCTEW